MELASATPLDSYEHSNFAQPSENSSWWHLGDQTQRASAQWNSWYDISKARNTLVVPGLATNSWSVSSSTPPSQDSSRRGAEIASRKLVRSPETWWTQNCMHPQGIGFGTSCENDIQEVQYFYSLPERSKLRSMLANQDDNGSLQKAKWRSSTSGRKNWWLDNSRWQSLQWERWISKQSLICNRGAGLSLSMDSILSVQSKNFSGDGEEFTKVSRTVGKATSHLHSYFPHAIDPRRMVLLKERYAE